MSQVEQEKPELSSTDKARICLTLIFALVVAIIGVCMLSDHYAKPQLVVQTVHSKLIAGSDEQCYLITEEDKRKEHPQHIVVSKEQCGQIKIGQAVMLRCLVGVIGDPMKCQFVRGLDDQVSGS